MYAITIREIRGCEFEGKHGEVYDKVWREKKREGRKAVIILQSPK